ncbi:MAG: hypothetical protein HDQ99_05550 [Lachnospiraceae bacterium]|nr:hypothetical protein [Lachnospiraceae bacterium]
MKEIKNLQEKRLIIARHIMLEQIEPTDENIINAWCNPFSADKYKLEHAEDTELFDWMRKFISSNDVKSCKEQLARLRRKGERNLKSKGEHGGYGAKLVKEPKDTLATYNIFTKGKKYSGNYSALCLRMGRLPKKD